MFDSNGGGGWGVGEKGKTEEGGSSYVSAAGLSISVTFSLAPRVSFRMPEVGEVGRSRVMISAFGTAWESESAEYPVNAPSSRTME